MDTTVVVLWATLIVAWGLIPAIIIHYRLVAVPKRYEEIRSRFIHRPADATRSGNLPAVVHYARLLRPDAGVEQAERLLRDQFWYFHAWSRYALPLIVVAILSGLMLLFSGLWITDALTRATDAVSSPLARIDASYVMALWGAFVWSLYEVGSRRSSGDLTPVEVLDIGLRFVVAIPIGHAFSLLVADTVPALAAFAASAFPLRDVRQFVRKLTLTRLGHSTVNTASQSTRGYLGDLLSGFGTDTVVRLEELNIETHLDLAYADPVRLMIKTGVPIQLVLAWVDQALLAVYASPRKKGKFDEFGMPCALDVREFYLNHCANDEHGSPRPWRDDPAVKNLSTALEIPLENLPQLLRSIAEDPHVRFLSAAWYVPVALPAGP